MLPDMIAEEEFEIKEEQQWYDHRDLEHGKTACILHPITIIRKKIMQAFYNRRVSGIHWPFFIYNSLSIKGNVI